MFLNYVYMQTDLLVTSYITSTISMFVELCNPTNNISFVTGFNFILSNNKYTILNNALILKHVKACIYIF